MTTPQESQSQGIREWLQAYTPMAVRSAPLGGFPVAASARTTTMTARGRGGQYVVENVTLLSGGAHAFEKRYKVALTETSFRTQGNSKIAYSLLHFLICCIDPDQAPNDFKPCFPIMDREQERDFKKVVDANLAVLEKGKLIPPRVGTKSVVSAAGGEKFEQLVWMLSTVALQQAALRHPAHATAHSLAPALPTPSADAGRRYAGLLRSRTAAERAAFARTTQLGRDASVRWGESISGLNGRIGEVEMKTARLRKELAGFGFDERGVDLRKLEMERVSRDRGNVPTAAGVKAGVGLAMPDRVVTPMTVHASGYNAPASPALATDGSSEPLSATLATPGASEPVSVTGSLAPVSVTSSELQMSADRELLDKLHHLLDFGQGETVNNGAAAERVLERIASDDRNHPATHEEPSKPKRDNTKSPDEFFDFPPELKPCSDIAELVRAAAKELDNGAKRINIIAQQTRKKAEGSDVKREDTETRLLGALTEEVQKSLSYYKNISEATATLTARASGAAWAAGRSSALADGAAADGELETLLLKTVCLPAEEDGEPKWLADAEMLEAEGGGEQSPKRVGGRETDADETGSNADDQPAAQAHQLETSFLSTVDDLRRANNALQLARGATPPTIPVNPPANAPSESDTRPPPSPYEGPTSPTMLVPPTPRQLSLTPGLMPSFASQRAATLAQRLAAARAGSALSARAGMPSLSAATGIPLSTGMPADPKSPTPVGECDKLSITSLSDARNDPREEAVSVASLVHSTHPREAISVASLVHDVPSLVHSTLAEVPSTLMEGDGRSETTSASSFSWNRRVTSSLAANHDDSRSFSSMSVSGRKTAGCEEGAREEAGEMEETDDDGRDEEKSAAAEAKQSRIKSLRARLTALR